MWSNEMKGIQLTLLKNKNPNVETTLGSVHY